MFLMLCKYLLMQPFHLGPNWPIIHLQDFVSNVNFALDKRGEVLHFGLSAADPETIRKAHAIQPIAALQSQYSLWNRELEASVLPVLKELEIGLVAYGPLGHVYLTGMIDRNTTFNANDVRNRFPQFTKENRDASAQLISAVSAFAERRQITPAQLALAWVLHQDSSFVPIPGTTS
jgi:aryl-alcohol dehydrogenase-like predicted oxidoreductase